MRVAREAAAAAGRRRRRRRPAGDSRGASLRRFLVGGFSAASWASAWAASESLSSRSRPARRPMCCGAHCCPGNRHANRRSASLALSAVAMPRLVSASERKALRSAAIIELAAPAAACAASSMRGRPDEWLGQAAAGALHASRCRAAVSAARAPALLVGCVSVCLHGRVGHGAVCAGGKSGRKLKEGACRARQGNSSRRARH